MHLIVDADPIVYRAGFAAESVDYHLVIGDEAGNVWEEYFAPQDGKTAGSRMQTHLRERSDLTVLEKERTVHVEPESHALEATRTQLCSIEKECREYYQVEQFDSITPLLSGPGNYRERIATIVPYKGNRDPLHKPVHYQAIRNYLTGDWGAIVIHGREADDECSIRALQYRQSGIPYIIATIDKDLDQIPGHHYNYHKQVFYTQSERDAYSWFLQQCLSGDATDGVPGCYKLGAVKSAKLVEQWLAECGNSVGIGLSTAGSDNTAVSRSTNEKAQYATGIWGRIVAEYRASQVRPGCPYLEGGAETASRVALETARLVYLQQEEGELWVPWGPPHERLPDYIDDVQQDSLSSVQSEKP